MDTSRVFFGKVYNPEAFDGLYKMLDYVTKAFFGKGVVSTLSQRVVEEIMNILEHNRSWNVMEVRTKLNPSKTRLKVKIIYDGGEYFDPDVYSVGNVVGAMDEFKFYERSVEIFDNESRNVEIRINIEP